MATCGNQTIRFCDGKSHPSDTFGTSETHKRKARAARHRALPQLIKTTRNTYHEATCDMSGLSIGYAY